MPDSAVTSVTPILILDAIEPSLPFWTDRLGFALGITVPDAPPYAFAIVARDGQEVMLQTRASCEADMPGVVSEVARAVVYISVSSLDPLIATLGDAPVAVPRRSTFYGADEIFVRDPAGNLIGLAAMPAE